ncbi:BLUF domain-containing protein [Aurantimonas sp. VKM B-3413]|uniref:BLUF domain-containing protein n=1 Tax=Aurantimonas sp. VKM B-3413 TaxID=2779401 RepID=UPI001E61A4CB|nr:BLUF domain-containing protein [Aurantimonas sp. VKM B-3413]MCB8836715.1 BLUF domain-containing protein [Aurantimonas sp. VKM B-3413]
MRHIAYSSTAEGLTHEEFASIVEHARAANAERQISGAIAFDGRIVTQIIEGPARQVDELFLTIRRDSRHRGVVLLTRADITESRFDGFGLSRMSPSDLYLISLATEERHGSGDTSLTPLPMDQ